MRARLVYLLALAFSLVVLRASADQIVMRNGDRFTGTIIKSDSKTLELKTDYSDSITVKWEAVQQVTSDQPLYVTSKAGQVLNGHRCARFWNFSLYNKMSVTLTLYSLARCLTVFSRSI